MNTHHKHQPPKLAVRIFRWYCNSERREELEGDLEELFINRLEGGSKLWNAKIFYWWNVLHCCRSYSRSTSQSKTTFMTSLYRSYITITMRQSWKNLGSVSFNIIGLGVALSLCIFVYMLYAYNLEFDSTYTKNSNTYRVHSVTLHNEKEKRNEFSPIALDDILRNKISGISQVSSYFTQNITVKRGIDFFQESTAIVSTDFVEMFEIPLWNGSFEEFDNQPLVYLTQPVAFKYFGDLDPIGENLTLYLKDTIKLQVTVGGVFDRIPANSSFRFQILINQNDYLRSMHHKSNNWSSNVPVSYTHLTLPTKRIV